MTGENVNGKTGDNNGENRTGSNSKDKTRIAERGKFIKYVISFLIIEQHGRE